MDGGLMKKPIKKVTCDDIEWCMNCPLWKLESIRCTHTPFSTNLPFCVVIKKLKLKYKNEPKTLKELEAIDLEREIEI